jgi:Icc-related predicted phosphoesterase
LKLLAFSDLHRDRDQAKRLAELAADVDVVIGAGDFATMHMGLGRTIDELRVIDKPTLLVPGNGETDAALWRACSGWPSARVLHGEAAEVNGRSFFGLGAGIPPTPFPWSFDVEEDEAAAKLEQCPEGAVLIVHSPPKGHVDKAFGRHLGSKAILNAIETKRPPLVLCGHVHQCWGQESKVGPATVVNVGPKGHFFEL